MQTLLLRLQGPLQSWGTTSRFDERDTQLEPSKSGVLGLICAALGRDRGEPVNDLATLRMGVRVDREGVVMRDYQTVTGVMKAEGTVRKDAVLSPRFYLSDAAFLVGLEGVDEALLARIQQALSAPVWPLSLGRKSCVPGLPVWLPDGLQRLSLEEALQTYPLLVPRQTSTVPHTCRTMIEDLSEGSSRLDQPVAPFAARRFGPRLVKSGVVNVPN